MIPFQLCISRSVHQLRMPKPTLQPMCETEGEVRNTVLLVANQIDFFFNHLSIYYANERLIWKSISQQSPLCDKIYIRYCLTVVPHTLPVGCKMTDTSETIA